MATLKYGIGKQDFADMIERGFVYVDKTRYIRKLLDGSDLYFLSRPRRFGKSLFLSTLESFFEGRRRLFDGLDIETYPWDWEPYPVIRLSFAQGDFSSTEGLRRRISALLGFAEKKYGIRGEGPEPNLRLESLIHQLHELTGKKVAVLVDEYEKPLLDTYGEPAFERNRRELSAFYSVFKDNTEHLKLLFITGITRFGQLNIFSGLNNLKDISLSREFSAICGITREEIETYLTAGVEDFAAAEGCTAEKALELLKYYYDGYHFSEDLTDIYNPWSLLNCLGEGRLKSDWFASGSPRYLLKILKQKDYDLEGLLGTQVGEDELSGYGSDVMDPTALLYQSGYLTIKRYDRKTHLYEIGLPNFEVRTALMQAIIPYYLGKDDKFDRRDIFRLSQYIDDGKPEQMMQWLAAYFSKISFDSKIRFERDFHVLVLGIFLLIKDFQDVHCEYAMSSGRTDLVMETDLYVYVFEFKIGENAEKALEQIDFRGYDVPWKADGRKVFKIGAAFSTANNGILHYRIESDGEV